jgi:hypothetical protein
MSGEIFCIVLQVLRPGMLIMFLIFMSAPHCKLSGLSLWFFQLHT